MTPEDRENTVPLNPVASARPEDAADSGHATAEQGPPPADFAQRPRSGVPVPTGEALPADQVAALVGENPAQTEAAHALAGEAGTGEDRDETTES